jgi:hypothetical protein
MIVAARNRDFWFDRGQGVRTLMLGLARARVLHPNQTLVVTGLDGGRFYASLTENAARAMDLGRVYLAPGSKANIDPLPGEPDAATFELPWAALNKGLADGSAVVYAASGEQLRNVSAIYRAIAASNARRDKAVDRVEPASTLYANQLGKGWLSTGGQARWMAQRATVFLSPAPNGDRAKKYTKLIVEGYCPEVQFQHGTFRIQARANGTKLGQALVTLPAGLFRLEFAVPQNLATSISEIELEADHVLPLPEGDHASVLISSIFLSEI